MKKSLNVLLSLMFAASISACNLNSSQTDVNKIDSQEIKKVENTIQKVNISKKQVFDLGNNTGVNLDLNVNLNQNKKFNIKGLTFDGSNGEYNPANGATGLKDITIKLVKYTGASAATANPSTSAAAAPFFDGTETDTSVVQTVTVDRAALSLASNAAINNFTITFNNLKIASTYYVVAQANGGVDSANSGNAFNVTEIDATNNSGGTAFGTTTITVAADGTVTPASAYNLNINLSDAVIDNSTSGTANITNGNTTVPAESITVS